MRYFRAAGIPAAHLGTLVIHSSTDGQSSGIPNVLDVLGLHPGRIRLPEAIIKQVHAGTSRPPAFIVPFMRLPIIAFRLKIGGIFGRLFACITHVGRKTGRAHQTILAVMAYDPVEREICVVSPWRSSNWVKNIIAAPALRIQTGLEDFVPQHRFLTSEEIATLMEGYRSQHPMLSRILCRIPGWKWDSSHAEFVELATSIRGVAFTPRREHLSP